MPYTYEYDIDYDPAMPQVEVLIGRALDATDLSLAAIYCAGDIKPFPPLWWRHI
ncbi:MAG: hypothetical protein ACE5EY_18005 [Anaerolineae bacterium]